MRLLIILFSAFMFFITSPFFDEDESIWEDAYCEGDTKYDLIIAEAEKHLGKPYDASLRNGFDCSGFVRHCYLSADIKIPRSSKHIYEDGTKKNIEDAVSGDIIAFKGRDLSSIEAGHVGIVHQIESSKIFFIHSSSSRGLVIDSLGMPYYKKRYIGIVEY